MINDEFLNYELLNDDDEKDDDSSGDVDDDGHIRHYNYFINVL